VTVPSALPDQIEACSREFCFDNVEHFVMSKIKYALTCTQKCRNGLQENTSTSLQQMRQFKNRLLQQTSRTSILYDPPLLQAHCNARTGARQHQRMPTIEDLVLVLSGLCKAEGQQFE
jgi:hypothetical protein